jgi:hypothetical protein
MISKNYSNKSIITLHSKKTFKESNPESKIISSTVEDKENLPINLNRISSKEQSEMLSNHNSLSNASFKNNTKLSGKNDLCSNKTNFLNHNQVIVKEQRLPLTVTNILNKLNKISKSEVSLIESNSTSSKGSNKNILFLEKNSLHLKQNLILNNKFSLETINEGKTLI